MKNDAEDILGLIGGIYDAAFDPGLWPDTLARITDAVGGSQVMMGVHDFATRSLRVIAPRMSPEHLTFYATQWAADDILWKRTNRAPVGAVLLAERFVSRNELKATELYNEWYRAVSIGVSGLGVNLPGLDGIPAICGIKRAARDDHFSAEEIRVFSTLVPHLVRATRIHQQLFELDLKAQIASAEIDSQHYGIMVVDRESRLVYCNEIATLMLQELPEFSFKYGVLSLDEGDETARLRRLIDSCAAPSAGSHHSIGGEMTVMRPRQSPLKIRVAPFPGKERRSAHIWSTPGRPAAILIICDLERERLRRKVQLQSDLGLTAAEADLALEILLGDGREAAAARLGITTGTARIHLQRIFHKLGVHRQAEFVRFVTEFFKAH